LPGRVDIVVLIPVFYSIPGTENKAKYFQ